MGLLTAAFLALGRRFALGVGSCDVGNSRTCLGSPGAGRGRWLCLACWGLELLGFLSLVLSAAEGLVLSFGQASPLSSVDGCTCPNLTEGLKRRERGEGAQQPMANTEGFSSSKGRSALSSRSWGKMPLLCRKMKVGWLAAVASVCCGWEFPKPL